MQPQSEAQQLRRQSAADSTKFKRRESVYVMKVDLTEPQSVKSSIKQKGQTTTKSSKSKVAKKKKKKGKKKKKKKMAVVDFVATTPAAQNSSSVIQAFSPVAAKLFLGMFGQDVGQNISSNETEEKNEASNTLKRQNAAVVESSESEYYSESEGSEDNQKVVLTASHAIQEKVTFQVGEDPLIIELPSYNLTGQQQRVFRQQNGKPAPEFANLTDRGIFIQSDDIQDKGRYFLQLTTTIASNGQDYTDTQYFTLVLVSDLNQQSQNSASQAGESHNKDIIIAEKINQTNKSNSQVGLNNKGSFQEPGEENIWDQKFQSENTSMQHFNTQQNKLETQLANQITQVESKLSQEELNTLSKVESPVKASSPLRRKSRSNSDSEALNLQHNQQAVESQFRNQTDIQQHFKTYQTDEDQSRGSRQQAPTDRTPQNLGQTQKQRQSILRLPTLNTSSGMLREINMITSQGLVQQTEDQAEESWDDSEGRSDVDSQKSDSPQSRPTSRHPQTQKNVSQAKLFQIEEEASFSDIVAPLIDTKQTRQKNYASRQSEIVTTELSRHLAKFQDEIKTQKERSQSRSRSPKSLKNSSNKFHQNTDMLSEIRNLQIKNTQQNLLVSDVQPHRYKPSTTVETEKFISFSEQQNKNFNQNSSPNEKVTERKNSKSPIKNYQNQDSQNGEKLQLATIKQAALFSNGSVAQSHEGLSTFELSHQEKIKQRSERIRDSNKVVSQKKPIQNHIVPLQEQRENRRRSRGQRANQNPDSVSPISLSAMNHRYFQEGPRFTEFGLNNTQSLDGLKEYQNESESQTQQSLQSTQQYDVLMATLNSIQSDSLKQSFQYAAEVGHMDIEKNKKRKSDQIKQTFGKESYKYESSFGKSQDKTEKTQLQIVEDSSDNNSVSTHNAEIVVQSGSHNGKASLQLLIEYNERKALKQNKKLRDKIQKIKLQMVVEAGTLPEEFMRSRMEETMGLFDILHEKEEAEINRQLRLQIESAQDNARKMQGQLQQQEQERFFIMQATQLKAQKTSANEELLLKSYLYDAISQTQNLKLKCNFLGTEKRSLQEKVDLLLDKINKAGTSISEHELNLARLEQEQEEGAKQLQQNLMQLQPIQSEIESLKNVNEALESQVNDYKVELEARLQDQGKVLNKCDQINEKQSKLELLIEKNTVSINQFNHECDQMSGEVMRVWSLLQQESSRLQVLQKQIMQDQLQSQTHKRNYQLEQQHDYLNQQRAAQIRAVKQAELDHQNWLLEMEFQRQKELLKLSQHQVQRPIVHVPVQTQTQQHLVFTPKRSQNKDNKNELASQARSEHTPEPTRQTKQPDNSIFGGNDDLPDSMRFTTTYRQFANNQKFTGKKEGENGGEDVFFQSEASFTRFGTIWDRQEKAPQQRNISASRERLVNEGQDMAMLLRPGSVTPQNNFKFGVQKFLASPVNKKMMAQLPKLRNELSVLQDQRHMEKRTERRNKLDAQIACCENRITEIENKISTQ